MATTATRYTADDLARMATDEPWELWDGVLRKVPGAGGTASGLAQWIGILVGLFARSRQLGAVTGADGTYIVLRDPQTIVVPDVAFIKWNRLPGGVLPDEYIPVPPDLAIEVVSPTDEAADIARKQDLYRRAGIPLVWWVYPDRRSVVVFRDGQQVAEVGEEGELEGEPVLPDFRLPVFEIFAGF